MLKCFSFSLKAQIWPELRLVKLKKTAAWHPCMVVCQSKHSQKQGGGCGSGMALKPSCSQTKGRRPSWPNWIMGDVVRMLVSLSLYQPLTNLIIRALAAVWGRKGAFSGSTQELEGWAPDRKRKESREVKELQLVLFIMMLMCICKMHVRASSIL